MAKYILIMILGAMVTFGISNISQNTTVNEGTKNVVDNFANNRAHDIASSMSEILLLRIANDQTYRVNTRAKEEMFGGQAAYTVEDTFFDGDSLIKIIVAAEYFGAEKIITTYIAKPTDGWVPPVIRGAWTANGNLNNTISDMYIDGRNHDFALNIIPNTGKAGVSTSTTFINVENAAIGGTNNFIDYPMTFPQVPEVIEENYYWGETFPQTPDEILGYPEGTLKEAAKSGKSGSQYVLVPNDAKKIDGDLLTYPVSGVTYIEITNAKEYELKFEQSGNGGIVVVHKKNGGSRLKGVKYNKDNSDGLLAGLLITDYSFHHHIDILGGVLQLSSNLETSKNCNGNKDHWVYYSSEAIESATKIAADITGLSGKVGYGFGKKRVNVKHVYE
ncbi:hypothetical protein ACFLSH_00765 [Bacteroidota bacterium]